MGTVDKSVWVTSRYVTTDTRGSPKTFSRTQKFVRTRTGTSNPKWRDAIANHTNAATVLSGTFETIDVSLVSGVKRVRDVNVPVTNDRYYTIKGDFLGQQFPQAYTGPDLLGDTAEVQATMRAYKQIQAATQKFNGGVFLGELRQTLSMLRNPAKGILDGLQNYLASLADWQRADRIKNARLRKGEKARSKRQAEQAARDRLKRAAAQGWLEASYGWLPFIADLEDAAVAYNRLVNENNADQYEKIKAVGKHTAFVNAGTQLISPIANFTWLCNTREQQEAVFIIRGEVRSRPKLTAMDKASVLGLAPGDFVPTIWNLIPWSFLVDYFLNVGDVLEASSTDLSGVTWMVGTGVRSRIKEVTCRVGPQPDASAVLAISGNQARLKYKRRTVSRSTPYSLQNPSLYFRLPTSPLKQANMLALWTQANSIHPQKFDFFRGRTFRSAG